MKKFLLSVVALAAFAIAQAQIGIASEYKAKPYAAGTSGIRFGVKAGLNLSKFTGSDASIGTVDPKFRAGFHGGLLVNIPFGGMFAVQPELLYSMEGAHYEESGDKLDYKLNYFNIPIMFQFVKSGFVAETGPQIGFLMSAKADDGTDEVDIKDNLKSTNFSWALGIGYRMQSGFGIGARYNFGLSSIDDETDSDVKQSGFGISLYYLFGGDKK